MPYGQLPFAVVIEITWRRARHDTHNSLPSLRDSSRPGSSGTVGSSLHQQTHWSGLPGDVRFGIFLGPALHPILCLGDLSPIWLPEMMIQFSWMVLDD